MANIPRSPTYQRAELSPRLNTLEDSTKGSSKALLKELVVPSGTNRFLQSIAAPPYIMTVVDTSKGTFKPMLVELVLPRGTNKEQQSITTPAYIRNVVDTTWDSFKPLLVELVVPAGTNKLVAETKLPELPRILNYPSSGIFPGYISVLVQSPVKNILFPLVERPREIYASSYSSLIEVPADSPFVSANELPLLRYIFTLPDTSRGTAKVLIAEVVLPIGKTMYLGPQKFWFAPADTSKGMPKTVVADATLPIQNLVQSVLDRPKQLYNYIYNNFEVLTFVAPAPTTGTLSGMLASQLVRRAMRRGRGRR